MRAWLAAFGGLAALIGLAGEWRRPLNGDAAYLLDAARRMREGAGLYRDLLDLNPPFIFWLNVPVVAVGEAVGIGPVPAFRLAVVAAIALGGWLSWRLLAASPLSPRTRYVLLFAFVFTALAMPLAYFGEREHLLFALVFPWVILAALRADGIGVARGLALAVGAVAGVGILLKPPAGLIVAGLALLVVTSRRSLRPLLGAEVAGVAAVLTGGMLAVVAAAPEYLETVRRFGSLYWEFSHRPASVIATRDIHAWTIWLALAVGAATAGGLRARTPALALAVAAAALFAAVFVQGKAFGYHYFPAIGMAVSLLLLCLLGESREAKGGTPRRVASGLALAASVGLFFLPAAVRRAFGGDSEFERQAREAHSILSRAPRGTSMMVLSSRLTDAYPLVLDQGARLVMRMPHLWFVPAAYQAAESTRVRPRLPGDMDVAERDLYRKVGEDLERGRPELVLVRNPGPGERRAGDLLFDYVDYFCADPTFARAFGTYRREPSAAGFDVFRRESATEGDRGCAA